MVFFKRAEQSVQQRPEQPPQQSALLFCAPGGAGERFVGLTASQRHQHIDQLIHGNGDIEQPLLQAGHVSAGSSASMSA